MTDDTPRCPICKTPIEGAQYNPSENLGHLEPCQHLVRAADD